jgi:hypothetical protein
MLNVCLYITRRAGDEAGHKPVNRANGRKNNMLVLNAQPPADANSLASTGDRIDEEEPTVNLP